MMRAKAVLAVVAGLLACTVLALGAGDASARGAYGYYGGGYSRGGYYGRSAFGTYYGRSFYRSGWTHNASISRSPGQVSGTRSFQTRNGRGATRTFNRSCSSGTCTRSASTTTNSGKTWSHSGTISHTRGSTTWSRNAAGPNGGTSSRTGSCTSGAGCSANATIAAGNGSNYAVQRSLTPNGQGGVNYNMTATGPNGSVTRSFPQ